eukprot:2375977-Amphidinium_carterae.1
MGCAASHGLVCTPTPTRGMCSAIVSGIRQVLVFSWCASLARAPLCSSTSEWKQGHSRTPANTMYP